MDITSAITILEKQGARDIRVHERAEDALLRLSTIYKHDVDNLKEAAVGLSDGRMPEEFDLHSCYPFVAFAISNDEPRVDPIAAFGYCRNGKGLYYTTITRPDIFGSYLSEQLRLVMEAHSVPVLVGVSSLKIPLEFAIDGSSIHVDPAAKRFFTRPELDLISRSNTAPAGMYSLSVFSALQTDYALGRLRHYTGTDPLHMQRFVLLTNYSMYIQAFVRYAVNAKGQHGYTDFVQPEAFLSEDAHAERKLPQMPAFHLKREDGNGVSVIDIGVGPSNALNMVRNLAALRPHAILMVGHCGGLRRTQSLGAFVLGEGYFRDDHVLNEKVPPNIPIPPIAEINNSLRQAVIEVSGIAPHEYKRWLESGTIATTGDRGWEIDEDLRQRIIDSRALAVDMESATVAACGFLYRVPYGTLLRISDKPLHGELKLQGMAQKFYRDSVDHHLQAALRAVEILRQDPNQVHSRKLRTADGPTFR